MKRVLKTILLLIVFLIIAALAGTWYMFRQELAITGSIRKYGDEHPFYTMEFPEGYHLDELLEKNISSDHELSVFLTEYISHGFYKADETPETHIGCSTLSVMSEDGRHLWGRNFDWYYSVPVIVKATPKDGYASLSTCEFTNITGDASILPEGTENSMLAVGAYFVPMDGINEKGLCVAELEVNEGGQELVDTEKKNITTTMAIRMILDKAATVDEAIALLEQYDICPSGGISSHLSISDSSGKAVAAEFINGEIIVTPTNAVTNFNIHNGDISAGGESAETRYTTLKNAYDEADGVMDVVGLTEALERASQKEGQWSTKWTLIYENAGEGMDSLQATYYWDADYSKGYHIDQNLKPQ